MSPVLENILRGILGMFFLIFVCFLFSNNRRAINWRLVLIGIVAQVCFALGVLKVNFVKVVFQWLSEKFVEVINIGHRGIEFLFGNLANAEGSWAYIFAVQVLPNIIFFSALSAMFYYLGILQKVVYVFAWMLKKLGISGPESVSTGAQYLSRSNRSATDDPSIPRQAHALRDPLYHGRWHGQYGRQCACCLCRISRRQ